MFEGCALEGEGGAVGGEEVGELGVEFGVGALEPLGVGGGCLGVQEVEVEEVGLEMDERAGVGVCGDICWRGRSRRGGCSYYIVACGLLGWAEVLLICGGRTTD